VSEQFLNRPEVGTTLEDVRCRGMAQTMWSNVGDPCLPCEAVNTLASRSRVKASTTGSHEERVFGMGTCHRRPHLDPGFKSSCGRPAERDYPLLGTLAHHLDGERMPINDAHIG
jgi:hypothetical protein